MLHDPWLDRWLALVQTRAAGTTVLEIGCGQGEDTATLAAAGLSVHAFDISQAATAVAKLRVPSANIECRNLRKPLPASAQNLGAIVASLSLHYFSWTETIDIVQRIRACLGPGGLLLCRLNSADDHNYGASGHPEIEPNFYLVNGEPKRFFNKASVQLLFADGWATLSLEHSTTGKYIKTKALWEIVLERKDD